MSADSFMPGVEHGHERIAAAEHLGIAGAEDDVRRLEHRPEVTARDAHHVADDEQRERLRQGRDEVDLALFAHPVDHLGANGLDRVEDALQLPWGERSGDDPTLTGVARVVHVDERPEELHGLRRHVGDRDRTLPGTEVLGSPADLDQLRVADDGVETLRQPRHQVLEHDRYERSRLAQLREDGHPIGERLSPEVRAYERRLGCGQRFSLVIRQ